MVVVVVGETLPSFPFPNNSFHFRVVSPPLSLCTLHPLLGGKGGRVGEEGGEGEVAAGKLFTASPPFGYGVSY